MKTPYLLLIRLYLGNKHVHRLTSSGAYELRIDLTNKSNNKKYAKYKTFFVGDETSQYKLTIGGYSGDAGTIFVVNNASGYPRRTILLQMHHHNVS